MFAEILVGGGLAGIGYLAGRLDPGRKRRRYKDPEPICGCNHHYSLHNADGCHGLMAGTRSPVRDAKGNPVKANGSFQFYTEKVPCGCKRYAGPEPLVTITAALPLITGGVDES